MSTPLLREQEFLFSPKNLFLQHAKITPYLALKDDAVVGHIATIVDENYIASHQDRGVKYLCLHL